MIKFITPIVNWDKYVNEWRDEPIEEISCRIDKAWDDLAKANECTRKP